MSKHTPGPWTWGVHDYSAASLQGPREDWDHVMTVGACDACTSREKKEADAAGREPRFKFGRCTVPSEADANLIAAAPEMLKALRDFVEWIEKDGIRVPAWHRVGGPDVLSQARALLAKIEGES